MRPSLVTKPACVSTSGWRREQSPLHLGPTDFPKPERRADCSRFAAKTFEFLRGEEPAGLSTQGRQPVCGFVRLVSRPRYDNVGQRYRYLLLLLGFDLARQTPWGPTHALVLACYVCGFRSVGTLIARLEALSCRSGRRRHSVLATLCSCADVSMVRLPPSRLTGQIWPAAPALDNDAKSCGGRRELLRHNLRPSVARWPLVDA